MQYGIRTWNDWIVHFYQFITKYSAANELVNQSDNDHYYWLMRSNDPLVIEQRVDKLIKLASQDHYLNAFINEVCFDVGCVIIV